MILVANEREKFILSTFFAYLPLGAAREPNCPTYEFLDVSPVVGVCITYHMNNLGEMEKVIGSLIKIIGEIYLTKDTLTLFKSNNGGMSKSLEFGQSLSDPFNIEKGKMYEEGTNCPRKSCLVYILSIGSNQTFLSYGLILESSKEHCLTKDALMRTTFSTYHQYSNYHDHDGKR